LAAPTTIPAGRSADAERRLRASGRLRDADGRDGWLEEWSGQWPDEWPDLWLHSERSGDSLRELRCAAVEHFARKGWVACHAAAFGDGRVALVPGASGSGKSTLAVTLAREGLAVSDELVFLREEGGCVVATAAPLPLSVSADTLARLSFAEAWRTGPCVRNGDEEKALLLPPRPLRGTHEVAAVVIRRSHVCGRPASLVKADARAAALGLLGSTYRFLHAGPGFAGARRRAWRVVTALVDGVPTYSLEGDLLAGGEAVCRLDRARVRPERNRHARLGDV